MNINENGLNVVIAGEGPGGLSAAILAGIQKCNVTVIKKRESYSRNQIIFLNDSSLNLLERIDVLKDLNIVPFELSGQKRGLVEISKLEQALIEKCYILGIKIINGQFLKTQHKNALVKTDSGEQLLPYELLVGADGAQSVVRNALMIECNQFGPKTLVGSSFIPSNKAMAANMEEKETADYYIRKVATPVGCFLLIHNKPSSSCLYANRQTIRKAAELFNWNKEVRQIEDCDVTNTEDVWVSLQQAKAFVNKEQQAILIGDATTTGSFYLGRGANLALKSAELAEHLIKTGLNSRSFNWYNSEMKKLSDGLIESNIHLFALKARL